MTSLTAVLFSQDFGSFGVKYTVFKNDSSANLFYFHHMEAL